jgi:predicted acylesterase/phospholipase RssA/CRP-like cAMP-binding protein
VVQAELAGACQFFDGIDAATLEDVTARMRPRHFAAREFICRQGEVGDSLFVIQDGVAQVVVEEVGGVRPLVRLRRGDVVGEMSLVTDEPRSASVIATVPTDVLELDRNAFAALLARHPALLANLSRILSRRLVRTSAQASRRRGEAVALLATPAAARLAADVIAATRDASPHSITALELVADGDGSPTHVRLDEALAVLDELLSKHATVIVLGAFEPDYLGPLLNQMDRVVLLVTPTEAPLLPIALASARGRIEIVLVSSEPPSSLPALRAVPLRKTIDPDRPRAGVAWLGRHLARTKLGLALGAGGAKGYAHVGVLQVLEQAGYTVDYVSGSSIGAIVGAYLALGMDAREIDAALRESFSPDNVAEVFKLGLSGSSTGLGLMERLMRETTGERTFADLDLPLAIMSVDLTDRRPAPIREGSLWEALMAATALAGMFPPYERDGHRMVDGLALDPVPTSAVVEDGADVTVSVNLMARDALPAWPGPDAPAPPAPKAQRGARMLDTLLEVMDLMQLDTSIKGAELADVPVTPLFGPGSWRDFHLADLFLEAGRVAAEEQLPALLSLARPQPAGVLT